MSMFNVFIIISHKTLNIHHKTCQARHFKHLFALLYLISRQFASWTELEKRTYTHMHKLQRAWVELRR
jgi:hypothetical protein